jgi:NADPH:quinone reductase-like Zn-dependent oxidoreductase
MKAINVHNGTGPAEALFPDTIPDPELKGDDILVRVKAFGINRADLMQREGTYPMLPVYGKILGLEFAGIVEAKSPQGKSTPGLRTSQYSIVNQHRIHSRLGIVSLG